MAAQLLEILKASRQVFKTNLRLARIEWMFLKNIPKQRSYWPMTTRICLVIVVLSKAITSVPRKSWIPILLNWADKLQGSRLWTERLLNQEKMTDWIYHSELRNKEKRRTLTVRHQKNFLQNEKGLFSGKPSSGSESKEESSGRRMKPKGLKRDQGGLAQKKPSPRYPILK